MKLLLLAPPSLTTLAAGAAGWVVFQGGELTTSPVLGPSTSIALGTLVAALVIAVPLTWKAARSFTLFSENVNRTLYGKGDEPGLLTRLTELEESLYGEKGEHGIVERVARLERQSVESERVLLELRRRLGMIDGEDRKVLGQGDAG